MISVLLPARIFLPMPPPEHVPCWEGPAPEEGTPRVSGEVQGLGAHVARRARTAAPRPKSTPPTSTRSFLSRRHKSRGYPRCRTGLQCGQFIVLEASPRLRIKVCIQIYLCIDYMCNICVSVVGWGCLGIEMAHPWQVVAQACAGSG